ncbi:MAG: hypothetical protein GY827_11590 [Cytophagales bacterium]|nr:hypothetical protein [Cytophagales bacterium]
MKFLLSARNLLVSISVVLCTITFSSCNRQSSCPAYDSDLAQKTPFDENGNVISKKRKKKKNGLVRRKNAKPY